VLKLVAKAVLVERFLQVGSDHAVPPLLATA
jgi:hypothetical protein